MDRDAYLPAQPRCVLCLTCANAAFDSCSAGMEQYGVRFACESFVRAFTGRGIDRGVARANAPRTKPGSRPAP